MGDLVDVAVRCKCNFGRGREVRGGPTLLPCLEVLATCGSVIRVVQGAVLAGRSKILGRRSSVPVWRGQLVTTQAGVDHAHCSSETKFHKKLSDALGRGPYVSYVCSRPARRVMITSATYAMTMETSCSVSS